MALRLALRMERRVQEELAAAMAAHPDEHELCHVARDLERWSVQNIERITEVAASLDADLDGPITDNEVLADLRRLYLAAAQASLAWEELAQVAQATQVTELTDLAATCHPQTLRQVRWANTMLKTQAPQALSSMQP
jgi:hypothetical protein